MSVASLAKATEEGFEGVTAGGSNRPPNGEDFDAIDGEGETMDEDADVDDMEGVIAGGGISVLVAAAAGVLVVDSPLALFLASNLFKAFALA